MLIHTYVQKYIQMGKTPIWYALFVADHTCTCAIITSIELLRQTVARTYGNVQKQKHEEEAWSISLTKPQANCYMYEVVFARSGGNTKYYIRRDASNNKSVVKALADVWTSFTSYLRWAFWCFPVPLNGPASLKPPTKADGISENIFLYFHRSMAPLSQKKFTIVQHVVMDGYQQNFIRSDS